MAKQAVIWTIAASTTEVFIFMTYGLLHEIGLTKGFDFWNRKVSKPLPWTKSKTCCFKHSRTDFTSKTNISFHTFKKDDNHMLLSTVTPINFIFLKKDDRWYVIGFNVPRKIHFLIPLKKHLINNFNSSKYIISLLFLFYFDFFLSIMFKVP